METKIAREKGCESHPGGNDPDNSKATWYVYKFDY